MKSTLREDMSDIDGTPRRLMYNRPANRLVLVVERVHDDEMRIDKVFFRSPDERRYLPIPSRTIFEHQQDACSSPSTPHVFFSEWRFTPGPQSPSWAGTGKAGEKPRCSWAGDWFGLRRFDLQTGEDKTILGPDDFAQRARHQRVWISQLMHITDDATSLIARVAFDRGGHVDYAVCQVSLVDESIDVLAELPRVFL